MKTIGLFDAKNRFSELCETVAATSEPVVVTRRGRPLVQVVPVKQDSEMSAVWASVEDGRTKYGPLADEFDLPPRALSKNRESPLE